MFGKGRGLVGGFLRGLSDQQRFLVVAVLVVQGLDVITTAFGLRAGLTETNGLAVFVFDRHGEVSVYLLKALVTFAILAGIFLFHRRYARVWVALRVIYVYMFAVVTFNLLNIALDHFA